MKFKNPYYKKIRGHYLMVISCGYCKEEVFSYQKVGRGGLLNLHPERVIEGNIDLSTKPKILVCPACKRELGLRKSLKRDSKEVYSMIRSSFNTRKIQS